MADNVLVASVASWSNAFDDAAEDEQTAFDFIETQFLPFLRSRTDLSDILSYSGLWARYAYSHTVDDRIPTDFFDGIVTVKATRELLNLVVQRKMRLQIILGALKRLQENQDHTLSLIQRNKT